MNIYLFRHGTTKSNELKQYTGFVDVSVSELGIKKLKELKKTKELPIPEVVVSSPMKRCLETLSVLYPNNEIKKTYSDLKETNFGDWEGKTYTDLKNDPKYRLWIDDITGSYPPNGESYNQVKTRVTKAFNEIIEEFEGKDVLIMCHGGVIRMIMHELINNEIGYFNWEIPNGLGYKLKLEENEFKYEVI